MQNYNKWVTRSAYYDLIITTPFAIPGVANWVINLFASLHQTLGFQGEFPAFQIQHLLVAHLLGSVVIVWSLLRIKHTSPLLGLYDGFARVLFSMFYIYAMNLGASPLILLFLIPELFFAVVQNLGYYQLKKQNVRLPSVA